MPTLLDENTFTATAIAFATILVIHRLFVRPIVVRIKPFGKLLAIVALLAVLASLSTAILSSTYVERLTRPRTRDGLPVLLVSYSRTPEIAAHIQQAQQEHPAWRMLHFNAAFPPLVTMNRTDACATWQEAPQSCDEYPFASTLEGGGIVGLDVSVAGVPLHEQRIQGGQIAAFYRQHRLKHGDPFLVKVVP